MYQYFFKSVLAPLKLWLRINTAFNDEVNKNPVDISFSAHGAITTKLKQGYLHMREINITCNELLYLEP